MGAECDKGTLPYASYHIFNNRARSLGDNFVSIAKMGPRTPSLGGNRYVQNKNKILTCSRIPHNAFSPFGLIAHAKIFQENAGFGVNCPPVAIQRANPDEKHNLAMLHCPDALYQI